MPKNGPRLEQRGVLDFFSSVVALAKPMISKLRRAQGENPNVSGRRCVHG